MRYFIELSYHGKNYHGWQIQPNVVSVQGQLQIALSTILQESITVIGAGRTDAGVHAEKMYAHFSICKQVDLSFVSKFNAILPNDIVIYNLFKVENDLHARFDAVSRSYEYRIYLGKSPFNTDLVWQYNRQLDVPLMNDACRILFDYTDFKCFSKVKTDVFTFNCEIKEAFWTVEGRNLIFHITANRFLRNMVRAVVGTLLEVGLNKMSLGQFREVIESRDRCNAGTSVPARGLFLTNIIYEGVNA